MNAEVVAVEQPEQAAAHGIVGLVVHKLIKSQSGIATIELRDNVIAVTPTATRLVEHLHTLFAQRPQKGFGQFEQDEDNFPIGRLVRDYYVQHATDFLELSRRMMAHLEARANSQPFATGGYVVIAHVTNGATNWLLALIVTEVLGTAITDGLDIIDTVHLDMTNLRVAGRINLTGWLGGEDRYISFLKGKADVANYFKLFLGCNDVVENHRESQKFVQALRQYATLEIQDVTVRGQILDEAFNYLVELSGRQEPVSLEAFANRFRPDDPNILLQYLTAPEWSLSDGFVPVKSAIKSLSTFRGHGMNWKIEFDRSALRCGEVDYDENENKLILSNISQALRDRLMEELHDNEDV